MARASGLHPEGHRFESCTAHHFSENGGINTIKWGTLHFLRTHDSDLQSVIFEVSEPVGSSANHFHFVIRVKDEVIQETKDPIFRKDRILKTISDDIEIGKLMTNQFRLLFISFTMAINKQENRSGGLLESKFKRLVIEDDEYLKYAIFYTHFNPEKHGIEFNFRNYKYSSYASVLSTKPTKINRDLILEIFDGVEEFISYHQFLRDEKEAIILE